MDDWHVIRTCYAGRWHGFALETLERRYPMGNGTYIAKEGGSRWRFVGWGKRARSYSQWRLTYWRPA